VASVSIRHLNIADLPAALELSNIAGWNQTAADWQTLLALDPTGCLALECDGRLASTTTLISYGAQLAWVGMVLTHPDYRGRGFARQLVSRAIKLAGIRKITTLKLDATEQGRPLYEKLGFQVEQEIQRWSGAGLIVHPSTPVPLDRIAELDSRLFGANRLPLLRKLAQLGHFSGSIEAYVMWRPGSRAHYLGPFAAVSPSEAQNLVSAGLPDKRWFWDLLPSNSDATALASDFGLRVERHLLRMYRGAPLRCEDSLNYGAAGFEFG
jgi:GNAT superfamily N-acetyltransferase